MTVSTPHAAFVDPPPEIELRMTEPVESLAACQAVWERCRLATPGFTTRPDPEISYTLKDLEGFCVFAGDDGYALYTVDRRWTGPNAEFQIKVQELMAATREAYAALWQYLCGLTHVVEVVANVRPIDEPLQHMIRQPRRVDISHAGDGVWLKPYDRAALCGRGLPDPGGWGTRRSRTSCWEPSRRRRWPSGPHPGGRRSGLGVRGGAVVAAGVLTVARNGRSALRKTPAGARPREPQVKGATTHRAGGMRGCRRCCVQPPSDAVNSASAEATGGRLKWQVMTTVHCTRDRSAELSFRARHQRRQSEPGRCRIRARHAIRRSRQMSRYGAQAIGDFCVGRCHASTRRRRDGDGDATLAARPRAWH